MGFTFMHQQPPGVNAAGNAAAQVARDALADLGNCLGPSAGAAAANPGWTSSGPLAECAGAWSAHLAELINRTSRLAENLHLSANLYDEADRRSAAVLRDFHAQPK
ncbi:MULTISPECIES: hypothetical protein [Amycolatopsis]|uniref:Excreted virulence factor EspC (Type VII ESX diderm) n=1 Tax=Amycolatopsis albidoflavus TaxID=102226 RepID=A0ABW5HWN9_9PSEU